jgi:hypothetical protein
VLNSSRLKLIGIRKSARYTPDVRPVKVMSKYPEFSLKKIPKNPAKESEYVRIFYNIVYS